MEMQGKKEKRNEKEEKGKTNQIVIDATNATLGRLASFAAKKLLAGTRVVVVNSEKAVVLGNRGNILQRYRKRRRIGKGSLKGPYFQRKPEAILKRTIRGMLPYKSTRGRTAFKNLICYTSIPITYAGAKKIISKRQKTTKYITLGEIFRLV